MSDVERLSSICQILDEQCDAVITRFAAAETCIEVLRISNKKLSATLFDLEQERDALLAEVDNLKAELVGLQTAKQAARELLQEFDEDWYLREYSDVRAAVEQGKLSSGLQHYLLQGYKERRQPVPSNRG